MQGCEEWTFKLFGCSDYKPIPDLSGRRVIDTSNPVNRTGIPPVLNLTSLPPCVDVTLPRNFLVGALDSTSWGCKSTARGFQAEPVCISHKPFVSL